jgi:hypothetical protein
MAIFGRNDLSVEQDDQFWGALLPLIGSALGPILGGASKGKEEDWASLISSIVGGVGKSVQEPGKYSALPQGDDLGGSSYVDPNIQRLMR